MTTNGKTADMKTTGSAQVRTVASIRADQNFAAAVSAAIAAAVAGAALWSVIVYATGFKLGLVSVAIGAAVGYAVRTVGKGVDTRFGVLGLIAAAFGWTLGSLLVTIASSSKAMGVSMMEIVAHFGLAKLVILTVRMADVMDIAFLGIAMYEGWKLSFRYRLANR